MAPPCADVRFLYRSGRNCQSASSVPRRGPWELHLQHHLHPPQHCARERHEGHGESRVIRVPGALRSVPDSVPGAEAASLSVAEALALLNHTRRWGLGPPTIRPEDKLVVFDVWFSVLGMEGWPSVLPNTCSASKVLQLQFFPALFATFPVPVTRYRTEAV